jgi:hypothetical protein
MTRARNLAQKQTNELPIVPLSGTAFAPQPRAATSKRPYRTRAELPPPFTPHRERASGKAQAFIGSLCNWASPLWSDFNGE